jgi:hypothetical protein
MVRVPAWKCSGSFTSDLERPTAGALIGVARINERDSNKPFLCRSFGAYLGRGSIPGNDPNLNYSRPSRTDTIQLAKIDPSKRRQIEFLSSYCPISNSTLDGDVLPDIDTVIGYSPSATCGTMKFTWNCPGATSAAPNTWASVVPIVTPTPVIGTGALRDGAKITSHIRANSIVPSGKYFATDQAK